MTTTFEKADARGPVEREWFDATGNYHRLYRNGATAVITAGVIADNKPLATEWRVERHTGYSSSEWRELYRGDDPVKAHDIYESTVRVMRRGGVRCLIDDVCCNEYIA